jgi:putative tricarboxylic transport membrane protein
MDFIGNLYLGFSTSLSPINIFYCAIGVTLGTIIGILPGLGPTATIAMLLPITYKMNLTSSLIMLAGIYYGCLYGGTITSVLVNIPGEAASVVTCIDGYQMARKGRAGAALGIAAFGSFIAGTVGTLALSLIGPPLAKTALAFGAAEFSSLMFMGLTLVMFLSSQSMLKALIMVIMGLLLGTVGLDPVTGMERFTFDTQILLDGISLPVVAMGVFGIGEILYLAEMDQERVIPEVISASTKLREILPTRKDWRDSAGAITRGSVIGFFLGIIPGVGAIIPTFISYTVEKKLSRHPEKFGTGAIEGVAGPESTNNSASAGAFVPLLTLGIPSNAIMALLVGAFMIHGVQPGPLLVKEHPETFWAIITSMYIGNVLLLILNVPLIGIFVKIIKIPFGILSPLIVFICFIGAFSINNNLLDIVSMSVFGVMGYVMKKFDFPAAPFILAFVLGGLLETSVRQALIISNGTLNIFILRPLSAVFLVLTVVILVSPLVKIVWPRKVDFLPKDGVQ